jgi:hypothetical protein
MPDERLAKRRRARLDAASALPANVMQTINCGMDQGDKE